MTSPGANSCRGCLGGLEATPGHSLLDLETRILYEKCTSLEIPMDCPPHTLCQVCFAKCKEWHQFRSMCHQNHQKLFLISQKGISGTRDTPDDREVVKKESRVPEQPEEATVIQPTARQLRKRGKQGSPEVATKKVKRNSQRCPSTENANLTITEILIELDTATVSSTEEDLTEIPENCEESQNLPEPPKKRRSKRDNSSPSSNSFKCSHCPKSFNRIGNLVIHTRTHTGEKPFECDVCGMKFARFHGMEKHKSRVHSVVKQEQKEFKVVTKSKKPLACPLCSLKFLEIELFKTHFFTKHNQDKDERDKISCQKCDFSATTPLLQLNHLITNHMNLSQLSCSDCGFHSSSLIAVLEHVPKSHDQNLNMCPICGKLVRNLYQHKLTHKSEETNKFQCRQCVKSFSSAVDLERHVLVHTGEKPHACEFCGRRFALLGNMKQHMRIHQKKDDEKSFSNISL